MSLDTSIQYPESLDSDTNLFLASDSLRVTLAEDYNPGDTSITIMGDSDVMAAFPTTGIITLTEQQSDIDLRAISFKYSSKTDTTFDGLEILSGFVDVVKPKNITHVTQNVMAEHHNNLKDALIAIEEFVGVAGTTDTQPFGSTLTGRINFLTKLILTPKAWFTSDKRFGLVPLTVTFTPQCFRTGSGYVVLTWDFGDSIISTVSVSSPDLIPAIEKTYTTPGIFDVSLKVANEHGNDTTEFNKMITARVEAPDEAEIDFVPKPNIQLSSLGNETPVFSRLGQIPAGESHGPWTVYLPTIRSSINTFVELEVKDGNRDAGHTNAGEILEDGNIVDRIETYTWDLGDDLQHSSSKMAKASYSIGGVYDIVLRVDTEFGAYRITKYESTIDIIEKKNLWLWIISEADNALAHEFGLISQTFKTADHTQHITRDSSFLSGLPEVVKDKAEIEFARNTGFAPKSFTQSGDYGDTMVVWASGGSDYPVDYTTHTVKAFLYNGFSDTYSSYYGTTITRPWNWIFLPIGSSAYFLFGPRPDALPNTNFSYQTLHTLNLISQAATETDLIYDNYKNGANELMEHIGTGYDESGEPNEGRFAVYRSAVKDSSGYFLRNDGVGAFFRIRSFYRTEGTVGEPFQYIRKLTDMGGSSKTEGQLVALDNGLYFFNNSGSIGHYDDTAGTWTVGGPSSSSAGFRSLQDSRVVDFDNESNTLLAASDGSKQAYLSYDYSTNAVIKFNAVDMTFSSLSARPTGTQWAMGVY